MNSHVLGRELAPAQETLHRALTDNDLPLWQASVKQIEIESSWKFRDQYNDTKHRLIHLATLKLDSRFLAALLQQQDLIDLNQTNSNGRTALHLAAYEGYLPQLKLLLDAGAALNRIDGSGLTALQLANRQGKQLIVAQLQAAISAKRVATGIATNASIIQYTSQRQQFQKMWLNSSATRLVLMTEEENELRVYHPIHKYHLKNLAFKQKIHEVIFSESAKQLFVSYGDTVSVFDSQTLDLLQEIQLNHPAQMLAVDPSSSKLVYAAPYHLSSLDLETKQSTKLSHQGFIKSLAFTASGEYLYVTKLGAIGIYRSESLNEVATYDSWSFSSIVNGEELLVHTSAPNQSHQFDLIDINGKLKTRFKNTTAFQQLDARLQHAGEDTFLLESFNQLSLMNLAGQSQKVALKDHQFFDFAYHPGHGYFLLNKSEFKLIDRSGFVKHRLLVDSSKPTDHAQNLNQPLDVSQLLSLREGELVSAESITFKISNLRPDVAITALDIKENYMALSYIDGSYGIWRLKIKRHKRGVEKGKIKSINARSEHQAENYFSDTISALALDVPQQHLYLGGLGRIGRVDFKGSENGELMLRGQESLITQLAITDDGRLLASSSLDQSLAYWDLAEGILLDRTKFQQGWIDKLHLSDELQLQASGPGIGSYHADLTSLRQSLDDPIPSLSPQTTNTSNLAEFTFSPDATQMANIDASTVRIWNIRTGLLQHRLFPVSGFVNDLIYSQDGKSLILAGGDQLEFWDPVSGQLQKVIDLSIYGGSIHQLSSLAKFNMIIATNRHGWHNPIVIHANSGARLGELPLNKHFIDSKETIVDLVVSDSQNRIAVYSSKNIYVFEFQNFKLKPIFITAREKPEVTNQYWRSYIEFSPDETLIQYLSFANKNQAVVQNIETKQTIARLTGKLAKFVGNNQLVYMSSNVQLTLYDLQSKTKQLFEPSNHQDLISALAYNQKTKLIVSGDIWGNTATWNTKTGSTIQQSNRFDHDVYVAELSANGRYLAYTNKQGLHIFDLKNMKHHKLDGNNYPYFGIFSSDNKYYYYRKQAKYIALSLDDMKSQTLFTTPWDIEQTSSTSLSADNNSLSFRIDEKLYIYSISDRTKISEVDLSLLNGKLATLSFDTGNQFLIGYVIKPLTNKNLSISLVRYHYNTKRLETLSEDVEYDFSDEISSASSLSNIKLNSVSADLTYYAYVIENHLLLKNLKTNEVLFNSYLPDLAAISFSENGARLLTATELGEITSYNLRELSIQAKRKVIDAQVNKIKISGGRVLILGDNEIIKVLKLESLEEIVSLAPRGAEDIMIMNSEGYYYATRSASQLGVAFKKGFDVYPFDQFDLIYNRPDKAFAPLLAAGITSEALLNSYQRAYAKRVSRFDIEDLGANSGLKNDLPKLIIDTSSLPVSTEEATVSLNYEASSQTAALTRLKVWVNNVPIDRVTGSKLKGKYKKGEININLSAGKNKIQAAVIDATGVASLRFSAVVFKNQPVEEQPKTHLIVIGASEYFDNSMNLNYAAKDAADIAVRVAADFVTQLLNKDVTKENILSLKKSLLKTSVDDKVILFYAGHGMLTEDYDYYLGSYDIDFDQPEENGLSFELLEGLFDGIPARNRLMLIDACHSGEADQSDEARITQIINQDTRLTANSLIAARGLDAYEDDESNSEQSSPQKLGLDGSFELSKMLFADIRKGSGITVISASGSAEFAYEYADLNNGVFTYAILNTLGQVSLSDLQDSVQTQVKVLTHGLQQPTFRAENIENNWSIEIAKP